MPLRVPRAPAAVALFTRAVGLRVQQSSSPALARGIALFTRLVARRRTARSRRFVHALIEWAPRQAVNVPVRFSGIEFVVDLRDNLQRILFYLAEYEGELNKLLVADAQPGDVLVDIGANIGTHALPAARALGEVGGRVVAFEAAQDTAELLRLLARRNDVHLDVEVVAVGRRRGRAVLRQSPNWDPHDLGVRSLHGEGSVVGEVDIVSFDEWAAERAFDRLDVVKIDVEGAEFDVLVGMRETLKRLRPRLLVVEVIEYFLLRGGSSAAELDGLLQELGYSTVGPSVAEIIEGPTDALWPMAVYRPV